MLTGSDLLAKVKDNCQLSKSQLVRACGYVSLQKDGSERLNFTAFYEALLTAKGIDVGLSAKGAKGPGGRKLNYTTKVQFNGNLLVGSAYTSQLDLKPGDVFEIKLGRKAITLIPAGSKAEDSDLDEAAVSGACALPTAALTASTLGAADVAIPAAADLHAEARGLVLA
jgi:hypothetical protein